MTIAIIIITSAIVAVIIQLFLNIARKKMIDDIINSIATARRDLERLETRRAELLNLINKLEVK